MTGKRVTIFGTVAVDIGASLVNGKASEQVRKVQCERTGQVFLVLDTVMDRLPVTHNRASFNYIY